MGIVQVIVERERPITVDVSGDFDGDGWPDLATATIDTSWAADPMLFSTRTFTPALTISFEP